jgi:hypothetical protein
MSKINKNKTNKMKRIIRLTEKDLSRLIKRMIHEVDETQYAEPSAELYASLEKNVDKDDDDMTQQVAEDWYRRRMNRRRLNENDEKKIEDIKKCYINTVTPFPKSSCSTGLTPLCVGKIRTTATSFFEGNKNAYNDPRIEKFWGCINKADPTILQGMG